MTPRRPAAVAVVLAIAACGTSGGGPPPRPIETLLYVSGVTGTQFTFPSDPTGCDSNGGTGIQAPNASHQFDGRVFQTPHLFVMENIRQPVRAVIRNTDTIPINVLLYLGRSPTGPVSVQAEIDRGQCKTIGTQGFEDLDPQPRGAQIQVEVCSPQVFEDDGTAVRSDLRLSCLDTTTTTPDLAADRGIAYFATIGDIQASNITNCVLPNLDNCRTPSTFFLEQPKDQVDAIMNVNPGQNPGGNVDPAEVRAELYVDGERREFEAGTNPVVSANL